MAEERIIDDEYGRGVRLRKTKEGFVDVTDELVETPSEAEEVGEEISFAFPMVDTDEDDEDLVGLSPEEAAELRKQKEEAAERLFADYTQAVAEGNELLQTGSYHAAELKFEKALGLDPVATEASVGYWKAKTANFSNPDVLIDEYTEQGLEEMEYDLGYEALEAIKKEYHGVFQNRYEELKAKEEPLFLEVSSKQERRRVILQERRKKKLLAFILGAVPTLVCLVLTVIFGLKNFSTPDNTYIPVTLVLGGVTLVGLFVSLGLGNRLANACKIYAQNELLESTEEGAELKEIMERMDMYAQLVEVRFEEDEEELTEEE